MKSARHASGFTLIEALVAVTLLALLFGALMPVFQQGLAVLRSGDRHTRAVLLAQSILDRQLVRDSTDQASAREGTEHGDYEDYSWQVIRAPYHGATADGQSEAADEAIVAQSGAQTSPFELLQISVVVRWPENEFGVQLHTLTIAASPAIEAAR